MKYLDTIRALSNANGAPGHEIEVMELCKGFFGGEVDFRLDDMLNAEACPKGFDESKPYIALDAHADEVGLMVQSFKKNGLISIITLGGWDLRNLLSQTFRIITETGKIVKAVVASVPPHFNKEQRELKAEDILLDVGASSIEEVKAMGIDLGNPIVPDTEFFVNEKSGIMMGKAFDDRLGCALVVEVFKELVSNGYTQVKAIFSTQEELGLRGAGVVSKRLNAKKIICFEGTPADDTLMPKEEAQSVLGKGPQIRLVDRTSISYPKWIRHIRNIAEQNDIKHQIAVRRGGGTNMGMYQHTANTTPTTVFGVPVRYIHAHRGIAQYQDFENALKLAVAVAKSELEK